MSKSIVLPIANKFKKFDIVNNYIEFKIEFKVLL